MTECRWGLANPALMDIPPSLTSNNVTLTDFSNFSTNLEPKLIQATFNFQIFLKDSEQNDNMYFPYLIVY